MTDMSKKKQISARVTPGFADDLQLVMEHFGIKNVSQVLYGSVASQATAIRQGLSYAPDIDLAAGRRRPTDPSHRDDKGRKLCPKCDTWKPESMYHKNAARADGLCDRCVECVKYDHVYRKYGLTREAYDAILDEQGGVCAICLEPGDTWHVDHDHSCCPGQKSCGNCVRGLLHLQCNTALGLLKDDPERLRRAASYLEATGKAV